MSDNYTLSTHGGKVTIRHGKREHTYTEQQLRANALSDSAPEWREALRLLEMVAGKDAQPAEVAQATQIGLFE